MIYTITSNLFKLNLYKIFVCTTSPMSKPIQWLRAMQQRVRESASEREKNVIIIISEKWWSKQNNTIVQLQFACEQNNEFYSLSSGFFCVLSNQISIITALVCSSFFAFHAPNSKSRLVLPAVVKMGRLSDCWWMEMECVEFCIQMSTDKTISINISNDFNSMHRWLKCISSVWLVASLL